VRATGAGIVAGEACCHPTHAGPEADRPSAFARQEVVPTLSLDRHRPNSGEMTGPAPLACSWVGTGLPIESPVDRRLTTSRQLGVGPAERLAAEEVAAVRHKSGLESVGSENRGGMPLLIPRDRGCDEMARHEYKSEVVRRRVCRPRGDLNCEFRGHRSQRVVAGEGRCDPITCRARSRPSIRLPPARSRVPLRLLLTSPSRCRVRTAGRQPDCDAS